MVIVLSNRDCLVFHWLYYRSSINMKKYKAIIKTTKEWTKDIKIPDDVEDIKDYVNDHFHETHYKNFDNSWKNNLIVPEEYEIIDIQATEGII